MKLLRSMYCRVFQGCFRLALPLLPYREPRPLSAMEDVIPVLRDHRITAALLVADQGVRRLGLTEGLEKALQEASIACTVYEQETPNPTIHQVEAARQRYIDGGCQAIIVVGGGSAMDCAKAVGARIARPRKSLQKMRGLLKVLKATPLLIAVPTTAGTGSEVTPFAVITDEKSGVKYPLADYELMPDMAIVDADLMMNAPKGLTSASGIDAVTHDLEAYASMLATDYTDGLALRSLKMIFENLPAAYDNGPNDPVAREKMANAATMAGMAFANAFLGVCHSMAHKLGAFHHLPHGVANALMIDEVIRFNSSEKPVKMGTFPQYDHPHTLNRYAQVADYLGIKGKNDTEKVENLIKAIDELKEKVGIKKTIRDYGIDEQDFLDRLDEMTEQAFDDQCTGANPRYPLMSEIKQMYLNAYYGTSERV